MPLSDDFQFSQASLQDYADCPRRFQLRYIDHLAWPSVVAEPLRVHEQHMQRGAIFHRMVHQHIIGIPENALTKMVGDDVELATWWQNYLDYKPGDSVFLAGDQEAKHYPEITLATTLAGYRLVAKYDLIAMQPGSRSAILDWKTAQKRPRRSSLQRRLQTRVYPYVLVRAGSYLNGQVAIEPGQVEMVYWFSQFPLSSERFPYAVENYQADEAYLERLINEITTLDLEVFPLTDNVRLCEFCRYRSLCDRGKQAGDFLAAEADLELESVDSGFELDFEQIAEVVF